jgi:hypothetical protein
MAQNVAAPSSFSASGLTRRMARNLARTTRFMQRSSGLIPVASLLECLSQAAVEGTVSFNDLAARVK